MKTVNAIARYEKLESIRNNQGGTFSKAFTKSMENEFSSIGLALLNASSLKLDKPVQWRGRSYPETL